MVSKPVSSAEKKQGFWAARSEKERYQLIGLAIFLGLMAMIVAVALFQRSLNEIDEDTSRYENALDFLATAGPAYSERAREGSALATHKDIDEESLTNNDIKLTSFLAEHAEKSGITISSYDEDQLPFGNKNAGGPIIVEQQLRVEIRSAEMPDLIDLLDRIEKSSQPVFIKRLDIRAQRKKPGEVRAIVTVATFVRKMQEPEE